MCLLLIEPATPGLEGERFIHYKIAAPFRRRVHVLGECSFQIKKIVKYLVHGPRGVGDWVKMLLVP